MINTKKVTPETVTPETVTPEKFFITKNNGVLSISKEDTSKDIETFVYRVSDKTEMFTLIDMDATKVAPIAKAILNEIELFPEFKVVKQIRILTWSIFIFLNIIFLVLIFLPASEKEVEGILKLNPSAQKVDNVKTKSVVSSGSTTNNIETLKNNLKSVGTEKTEVIAPRK